MQKHISLDVYRKKRPTSCNLIVIDDFYDSPLEVREFALNQEYFTDYYYPGKRTKSFATIDLKEKIQSFIEPVAGKIIQFNLHTGDNGSFQYATLSDQTWIHSDNVSMNWAGIVYLTPNAPLNSGTTFYRFRENSISDSVESNITNTNISHHSKDYTKWEVVDSVGNVFNRLVLFNSKRYHCSSNYFGDDIKSGRLFQVFFFQTENNTYN
jgi:hypothetical protein